MYCGYCEYSQHFEVLYCGYCRTRSISEVNYSAYPAPRTSSISGFCTYCGYRKYWQYFVRRYCEYCQYSQYQNTLNSHNMPSILGCMKFTSTICAQAVSILSSPLFGRKHAQTVGASYTRWRQMECLRVLAVFREYILRVLAASRGSVLRMLLALEVFRCSTLLWALPVLGFLYYSYSQYSQHLGL